MVERLEVSKSWLSRYLELAKMPPDVLAAFGSAHAIGISHGALLGPLLRVPVKRERLIVEARALAAEQAELAGQGGELMAAAAVARRLARAAEVSEPKRSKPREHVVRGADGGVMARGQRGARGGVLSITIPGPGRHKRSEVLAAVAEILDRIAGKPES